MTSLINQKVQEHNANWHFHKEVAKGYDRYTFCRKNYFEEKINQITIYIFNEENNHRTEVHVRSYNRNTYFKIIESGQKNLPNNNTYFFNSLWDRFPKNKNGLCDVKYIEKIEQAFGDRLFADTFLDSEISHYDKYETDDEGYQNVNTSLNILKEVDSTVEEIIEKFTEEAKPSSAEKPLI
jgi:hypothetical protein